MNNINGLKFKKKLGIKNGNLILTIPKELIEWLELHPQKELIIQPEIGKYGKFVSIYNENQVKNNDPNE